MRGRSPTVRQKRIVRDEKQLPGCYEDQLTRIVRYPIREAISWQLYKKSLQNEIADLAEDHFDVHDLDGDIVVTVDGPDFVATWRPK